MEQSVSYLKNLKFNPRLNNSWIAKYLSNPRLVILVLLSVIFLGSISYASLPKRLNPEVEIPLVIVSTVLPGANPQDVESLVTVPLENTIRSIEDVATVTSTSQDSVSVIQIEFESGINTDEARVNVQSAVDQVSLPTDAQNPQVQKIDFENQPVWTFILTGSSDPASINRFATILKDELESRPLIDRVRAGGLEEQEVSILVSPDVLSSYSVNTMQISQSIRTAFSSFPAGSVRTENSTFTLSIDPLVNDIEDVRNLKINLNGSVVPLSSIATITERSKPNAFGTYFASKDTKATRTVVMDVYKTTSADIDAAVVDAEHTVEELVKQQEGTFAVQSIQNSGELINEQFNHLIRDFILTIVLVFIVLFVFLGVRQAIVSLVAVPLTFLISFTVMNLMGISLNFLSMFSLLLSLGLLVDDTIVVISAMTSYFRSGRFTPYQTGILVWQDFLIAILTTTLTTVWAFLPLLLSGGIIGEFIKSIPIVVSSTLIASFFVAMFMTLPLMIILLKPEIPRRVVILFQSILIVVLIGIFLAVAPKGPLFPLAVISLAIALFVTIAVWFVMIQRTKQFVSSQKRKNTLVKRAPYFMENGILSFEKIGAIYRRAIRKILIDKRNRRRAIIMVVIFSIFSYMLLPLGFVKNEFFPASDQENLYVNLQLPAGTNSDVTEEESLKLLESLRKTKDVSYVTVDIGQAFDPNSGAGGGGGNTALFSFTLPDKSERNRSSIEIAEQLRSDFAAYPKGTVTVAEVSGGPPAGADLQIKLFGEDLAVLDEYANKIVEYLESQQGVVDVSKSIKEGTSKVVFTPDTDMMAILNLTPDAVGGLLRTYASGIELESAKITGLKDEEQDVTLRLGTGQQSLQDVYSFPVGTAMGMVPLSQLGNLELKPNPTLITREDGERTISVSAGIGAGYTVPEINQKLEAFANSELQLPSGYTWKTGGVNEENQESINSILVAMLLSFLLIIVTMVIQFGSFRKAIIVMLVIPLSISGVFIVFSLTGTPLSFPAIIGVLALFGIVVKNSILIVDKITTNQKFGMPYVESIIEAAESRLEPIALTSLATIMGLIPITLSDPLWRGLGGAIIAGLTFSGTIMLFFIPVVYYAWFNPGDKKVTRKKRV